MATRIQVRRDTLANFTANNVIPAFGEPIGVVGAGGVIQSYRIGDGRSAVSQLPSLGQRASVVNIEDYLPPTRTAGTTDDSDAFIAAVAAAAGKTLVLGSNALRITKNITISASNTTIDARGARINCVDDGTAVGVGFVIRDVNAVTWLGGSFTQAAASRSGLYGVIRLERVTNTLIDAVTIDGGSSTGVFVIGGQNIAIRNPRISNCKADGIHISRGATDVLIQAPIISAVGDDAIGIVAVMTEPSDSTKTYAQVRRVTVTDPVIRNMTAVGGGVSFVGVADCVLTGGIIDTVPTGGVKIADDSLAGATTRPSNIVIQGTIVRNSQNGFVIGASDDVQLAGVQGINNSDSGVAIVGGVRALVTGSKFRGNGGFGLFEASGSTDNAIIACDVRGNTSNAIQRQAILVRTCLGYADS